MRTSREKDAFEALIEPSCSRLQQLAQCWCYVLGSYLYSIQVPSARNLTYNIVSSQNMYTSLPLDLSVVYRSNQSRAQHTSLSSFLISGMFGRSKGLLTYRFWYVRSFKAALASADADRGLHNVNPKFDIPPVSSSPSLLFDILVISAPPVSLSPVASFLSRTS